MYRVVKDHGGKIDFINLMSYDGGIYYDPREGYESYKAIYNGPINMGANCAGGIRRGRPATNAAPGTVYDADMMNGQNNIATPYYNVETMVNYMKIRGRANDGFMLWRLWKQRVHQPAPSGARMRTARASTQCRNLPQSDQPIPSLPKL